MAIYGVDDSILDPHPLLSKLGSFLPLPHLERLEVVNCAAYHSKDDWQEILRGLPSLIILTLTESSDSVAQKTVLDALQIPSEDTRGLVCPRLRVLRLGGFNLSEEEQYMVDLCTYRASMGVPLGTLGILGVEPAATQRLQQTVPTVENKWDSYPD